jgi:hypothetical protein
MKHLTPRYLDIPLLMLVASIVYLVGVTIFSPDYDNVYLRVLDWSINFWYLAFSLAATEIVVRNIFTRLQEKPLIDIKNLHLQFIVRHLMIGIMLIICDWDNRFLDLGEVVQFFTIRLGITLFLLGSLVMYIAHRKMKSL